MIPWTALQSLRQDLRSSLTRSIQCYLFICPQRIISLLSRAQNNRDYSTLTVTQARDSARGDWIATRCRYG